MRFDGRALSVVVALWMTACGSGNVGNEGDVVGGPCTSDDACAGGSICLIEGDFPGGTCTVRCGSHADCPSGSACVEENGGTCLYGCDQDADCRAGYMCSEKSSMGGGPGSFVCIH